MKLSAFQPNIVALIAAHAGLSRAVVVRDDGSWPKNPERENGLKTQGVAVTVRKPKKVSRLETGEDGSFIDEMVCHVFVEQNFEIAMQGPEGLRLEIEDAVEAVHQAVVGRPIGTPVQQAQRTERFRTDDPGFELFDPENGVNAAVVPVSFRYHFTPGD